MRLPRTKRTRIAVFIFLITIAAVSIFYLNSVSLQKNGPKAYVSDFYLKFIGKTVDMKRKHEYRRGDVSTRKLTSYGLSSSFKRLSLAFPTTQNKTAAYSKTPKKTELKVSSKYWCDQLENEYPLVLNFTKLMIHGDREFKNIKPIHEHPFHYIFNASSACAAGDKIKVVCVVKSAYNNFEMREIIRKTWAKDAKEDGSKVLFALGYSNNQSFQEKIREENRIYMDIIQQNFLDSYNNNTLKTVMQIRWISKFCSNAIYVFMVDDDVIVNYRNLIHYFDNVNPADRNVLYSGNLKIHEKPMRHSKRWYASEEMYPYTCYPPFLSGGAILTSTEVIRKMSIAIPYVKSFRLDDVYLGILLQKLGISPQKNTKILMIHDLYGRIISNSSDFIARHVFQFPKKYLEMYQSLVRNK